MTVYGAVETRLLLDTHLYSLSHSNQVIGAVFHAHLLVLPLCHEES